MNTTVPRYVPEVSQLDTFTNANYPIAPTLLPLSDIAAGSNFSNRKGAIVRPIRLEVTGVVSVQTVATANWDVLRITVCRLLYDETVAAGPDLYQSAVAGLYTSAAFARDVIGQSLMDARLEVLHDHRFAVSSFYQGDIPFQWSIPLSGGPNGLIRYSDAGGTNKPLKGAIVAFICSDNGTVAQQPVLNCTWRLLFTDS